MRIFDEPDFHGLGRQQKQIHSQSKLEALNLCCGKHSLDSFLLKVS
jgi:hypothetical protein